ncbi:MAG: hypothetical protein E3J78_03995 [Candidatus Cloacimonadota bacterium]|nr:MAG: hypothetical protein E3J78_03995 [Candidatus Cloacimonadota bacterium]
MGNMFLGFPVPRAKIALMIEGAAPPLNHKENHEPDGSDPLILPGDISAGQIIKWNGTKFIGSAAPPGGLGNRYDDHDFFFTTRFLSLDGFETWITLDGTLTFEEEHLLINSSTTPNSVAGLYKRVDYSLPALTWDKARKFKCNLKLKSLTNKYGEIWIGMGSQTDGNRIAFTVKDGVLKGFTSSSSSPSTVVLETLGTSSYDETRNLECVFTPGSKAEFYINGSLIDEITTNIPSGSAGADCPIDLAVKNLAEGKIIAIYISQFSSYQAE